MAVKEENVKLFTEKAEAVHATVVTVSSMEEAYQYTVDLCDKKEACKLLVSGCEEKLSPKAGELCETKTGKTIAAPSISDEEFEALKAKAEEKGFQALRSDMRAHLGGMDIGFTYADYGLADTGSIVVNCPSEELRIATMISEYHVAVLPKSKLIAETYEMEDQLHEWMMNADYTAFITGPSRTADIERVLSVGVHGPLELHILLLEDA